MSCFLSLLFADTAIHKFKSLKLNGSVKLKSQILSVSRILEMFTLKNRLHKYYKKAREATVGDIGAAGVNP